MKTCRHFNDCGGCSFQDISYEEQVKNKVEKLSSITGCDNVDFIRSPEIYGFRNKMEYSFEDESLGLHPRGKFDKVVDLKECPVFSDWIGSFLEDVRKFAADNGVSYYSRRNKSGVLRYLLVKESKFTGQKMVILVVDGNSFVWADQFVDMVRKAIPDITTVVLAKRHRTGDTALTDDYEILYGNESIEMKMGHINVNVSPFSFCQPNSYQIENIYKLIGDNIEGGKILDLFTGVGSIALYLAGKGRDVTGVESFDSCVYNANNNYKKINPGGNVEFIQNTVRKFVSQINEPYDYVILDPPRGGMSYRVWKHLARIAQEQKSIKRIFYICCSLTNLASDIEYIRENTDWEICKITGVDQFVHTPHLETVVEFAP
jgi:23S rRNA (uracil-5-)-methyltransferase RumA